MAIKPKLLFHRKNIQAKARLLRKTADQFAIQVYFPVKSFPHPEFLKLIEPFIDGFVVNSSRERKLLPKGKSKTKTRVIFYQPGSVSKPRASVGELDSWIVDTLPAPSLRNLHPWYRLNPSQFGTHRQSRFGLSFHQVPDSADALHVHLSENNLPVSRFIDIAKKMAQASRRRGLKIQRMNLGGGFAHFQEKDLRAWFGGLRKIWPNKKVELVVEPGRFFSEGSGFAEAVVTHVEMEQKKVFLNLSPFVHLRGNYEIGLWVPPEPAGKKGLHRIQFQGPTAFEEDFLEMNLPKSYTFRIGQKILFSGISGYSVAWNRKIQGIDSADVVWI